MLNATTAYVLELLAVAVLVFLAGRAGLELILLRANREDIDAPVLADVNYIAIAFGAVLVHLITWVLGFGNVYRPQLVIAALAAIVCAAIASSSAFRRFLARPWLNVNAAFFAYLAGSFTFWLLFDAQSYPRRDTSLYLLQGTGLFFGQQGTEWPNYGVMIHEPILYTGYLITSLFALFSSGDRFLYYVQGLYWLNILLAPAIPIGAYLVFKRFMPALVALVAMVAFCATTVGIKIWTLRGETIGWVFGFAFLLVVLEMLALIGRDVPYRRLLRIAPVAALLLFSGILTHAVAAMAILVAIAAVGYFAVANRQPSRLKATAIAAATVAAMLVVLMTAFSLSFAHGASFMEGGGRQPAGQLDADFQFDSVTSGLPLNSPGPHVRAQPPYVPLKQLAEITAFLPVAALVRPGYADMPVRVFPGTALERLADLSRFERLLYLLLPLVFLALYVSPWRKFTTGAGHQTFAIGMVIYVALIAISVYEDSRSVALFPLAAIRRTFVYVGYFYWLAIFGAAADVLATVSARGLAAIEPMTAAIAPRLRGAGAFGRAGFYVLPAAFVAGWFYVSISPYAAGANLADPSYLATRFQLATPATKGAVERPDASELADLMGMMRFIRAHTSRNDWIYSNVLSTDNSFAYLSGGRQSILEGTAIYQLYAVQLAAATRIDRYMHFSETADPRYLGELPAHYVVLYVNDDCASVCYGDAVMPTRRYFFDGNPAYKRVYRNPHYVVYSVTGRSPSHDMRLVGTYLPGCLDPSQTDRVTMTACSRVLEPLRRAAPAVLPEALAHLGESYAGAGDTKRALADFHAAVQLDPANRTARLGLAASEFADGKALAAIGDYSAAMRADGPDGMALLLRAKAEMTVHRYADAIADATDALGFAGYGSQAQLQRVDAYEASGQILDEVEDLDTLAKTDPHLARLARARIALLSQKFKVDVSGLPAVVRACKADGPAVDLDKKIAACSELIDRAALVSHIDLADELTDRASAFAAKGSLAHARDDLLAALRYNGQDAQAYAGLAELDAQNGSISEALSGLDKAIRFAPNYAYYRYRHGTLYLIEGRYDAAIADFDRVLLLNSRYGAAYYQRGLAYKAQGNVERAALDFEMALKVNPGLLQAAGELKLLHRAPEATPAAG